MKKLSLDYFTAIIILVFSFPQHAQINFDNYSVLLSKGDVPEDLKKETYLKVENDLKKGRDELNKQQEKNFIRTIHYSVDEILHSGLVVFGDDVTNYINKVADNLLKEQPELRSKLRFYTLKSNVSNAFSTDQGIIFVTTGLISQLSSESQLAFVLAHEITHYTKNHLVEYYSWLYKNYTYDIQIEQLSHYSKEKELEADKLGLKLYHDAGYSVNDVLLVFDVFMYSYLPFDEIEMENTYFNSPFMYVPETMFPQHKYPILAEEEYDDTKSSHPNIRKRKTAIQQEIGTYQIWGNSSQFYSEEQFLYVRNICRFESIRIDILNLKFVNALYSIFLLEREFPNSIYLKHMKAHAWYNMIITKSTQKKSSNKKLDLEGESSLIHYFFNHLSKPATITLSLRTIYDLNQSNKEDIEIQLIYSNLTKYIAQNNLIEPEKYSTKTFKEATLELLTLNAEKPDSLIPANSTSNSSKYDHIKNKIPDSSNFYLFGISDILKDTVNFINLYNKYILKSDKYKIESENATEDKSRNKTDEKHLRKRNLNQQIIVSETRKYKEYKVEIQNVIVVEPTVYYYKHENVNQLKSEKLEATFSEAIKTSGNEVGMKITMLDSRSLTDIGVDAFNEQCLLYSFLKQVKNTNKNTVFPIDFEQLRMIRQHDSTQYVMFISVSSKFEPKFNDGAICISMLFFPSTLIYFPSQLLTGTKTILKIQILDLQNGKIIRQNEFIFNDSPKKYELSAHMYDILKLYYTPVEAGKKAESDQ